jgi:hypothetical protein
MMAVPFNQRKRLDVKVGHLYRKIIEPGKKM